MKFINRKEKKKKKQSKNKFKNLFAKFTKKQTKESNQLSLKAQIFSIIYFEIMGALFCLLILFILTGGKNYFKLYKDLNKLINVYDTIEANYYGKFDKEELIDNAISSMLSSIGDDYTTYTDANGNHDYFEELQGTYEGIGCTVYVNDKAEIVVMSLFDNGPAKEAGLKINDIIIKIDEEDFTNKTSEDVSEYVKNSKKENIKVTIKRNDDIKDIIIKRKKVEIPSVTSKVITKDNTKVGYIDISVFSAVTYKQFKNQLKDLEDKGIKGLIIDVRADTGGYLSSVTDISNLFLKKGKIIYQLEDDKGNEKIKDTTKEHREYPIAVLINRASASASEILASVIKESYGGIVVGTNSYGKGTVQRTKSLKDGSMIKYTTQKWLTPKGNWINEIGVEPTIVVEPIINETSDNQIDTALTEIINQLSN